MVWMKINSMMNLDAIQPREDHQSSVYGAQTKKSWHLFQTYVTRAFFKTAYHNMLPWLFVPTYHRANLFFFVFGRGEEEWKCSFQNIFDSWMRNSDIELKRDNVQFNHFHFLISEFSFCVFLRGLFNAWNGICWFESVRHVWINQRQAFDCSGEIRTKIKSIFELLLYFVHFFMLMGWHIYLSDVGTFSQLWLMMILFVNENFAQNTTTLRPGASTIFSIFLIVTLCHRYLHAEIIMVLIVDITDKSNEKAEI